MTQRRGGSQELSGHCTEWPVERERDEDVGQKVTFLGIVECIRIV